ncbi:hypothetical protein Pmani_028024 [Petrolisthes manimaculis]|uniref:Uncharacterized protein n=1 Tax=Petrolisthes manimaculis TaxID=1843537 RepID=A0AAE1TYE6_9EUCA|nr:hypothetical protein Pmani_028024 [Petrolisthes manimaculis]
MMRGGGGAQVNYQPLIGVRQWQHKAGRQAGRFPSPKSPLNINTNSHSVTRIPTPPGSYTPSRASQPGAASTLGSNKRFTVISSLFPLSNKVQDSHPLGMSYVDEGHLCFDCGPYDWMTQELANEFDLSVVMVLLCGSTMALNTRRHRSERI